MVLVKLLMASDVNVNKFECIESLVVVEECSDVDTQHGP